ncbi:hypothetical protein V1527DRAFT_515266 [Lipomyces starkeyi]
MVGLAGPRARQKIAHDPRNTSWSNDTDRFGHRHLSNLGWKPGTGLGLSAASYSIATHVKIKLKEDTLGLGASIAKANQDAGSWAPGLDSFQELLSRLNSGTNTPSNDDKGSEIEEMNKETMWETETKISQTYNRLGKWGARIKFVKGEKLGATIKDHALLLDRKEYDKLTVDALDMSSSNAIETAKRRSKKSRKSHTSEELIENDNSSGGKIDKSKKSGSDRHAKNDRKRKRHYSENDVGTDAEKKTKGTVEGTEKNEQEEENEENDTKKGKQDKKDKKDKRDKRDKKDKKNKKDKRDKKDKKERTERTNKAVKMEKGGGRRKNRN